MIAVTVIFGEDAVKEFGCTGQVPSDKWLEENGGVVTVETFCTKEEYAAYEKGVSDAVDWNDAHFLDPEIIPDDKIAESPLTTTISAKRNEILIAIRALMQAGNFTTLDVSEASNPTYVFWWDNANEPHEGQVLKVCCKDSELSLEVETETTPVTVYDSDPAFEYLEWLISIHDNIIEILNP